MYPYLFSIDLEDVRTWMPDGERYQPRVPANMARFLGWLAEKQARCTFFVVGDIARRYPDLVREIALAGHELACHSDQHLPLDQMTPETFRRDLANNIEALHRCGVPEITGYRAPVFSLTEDTAWAYPILAELGIRYSSSVLPARNPLYGWEGFGRTIRLLAAGVWEIPMSLARLGPLRIPYAGGIYMRLLPGFLSRFLARRDRTAGRPVLGYFHPYDIDGEQERFMHPGINNSRFYNALMYHNRHTVFRKLDRLCATGFTIMTYRDYLARELGT